MGSAAGNRHEVALIERGKNLSRGVLTHATAGLALGALVLYVLGVVGTVGKLRASHVDVAAALPRIPLEEHLRTGLTALFDPVLLLALLVVVVVPVVQGPDLRSLASRRNGRIATLLVAAVFALFVATTLPWPVALLGGLGIAPLASIPLLASYTDKRKLGPRWLLAGYGMVAAVTFLATAGLGAYFRSDPSPVARIVQPGGLLAKSTIVQGPLVAVDNGLVYVATDQRRRTGRLSTPYIAVPTNRIQSMRVTRRDRQTDEQTLLQLLRRG